MSNSSSPQNGTSERVGEKVCIYRRGQTWWARYQLDGRQQRESLKTQNIKEARRQAAVIDVDLMRGIHKLAPAPVTVDQVIEGHLEACMLRDLDPDTIRDYRRILEQMSQFATTKRRTKLHQLNLQFIDDYRKQRRDSREPHITAKTLWKEVTVIRSMVLYALSHDLIHDDPMRGLKNPKPKPTPQPVWSPDEVELILESAREPQKSMFTVFADTGMRFGELEWLTWKDLDFERGVIHIQPKDDWTPKSGDARATPMSDRLRELLSSRPQEFRWVFTAGKSREYPHGGHQISERRLLRSLKRLLKRIGLPETGKLHTFRHSFISKALACGVPQTLVKQWVGHVSQQTLDLYTHQLQTQSQAAMQRLSAYMAAQPSSTIPAQTDQGEKL